MSPPSRSSSDSRSAFVLSDASSRTATGSSGTGFDIVRGVIPCRSLYSSCLLRLLSVSRMAALIESVTLSAYMMTWPLTLRAARPNVCMRLV